MLPTTFEFRWDTGHMIFFGAFYSVVTVVLTSLVYTVVRSMIDVYRSCEADVGREPAGETELNEGAAEIGAET